jgi:hypothetical protein
MAACGTGSAPSNGRSALYRRQRRWSSGCQATGEPEHDDSLRPELRHSGQFGIDGSGLPAQNPPMSKATWFWPKADECGRMAKDASKADRRDHYETQAKVWRQLAEQVEANDKNVFGSDPK